jgi:vacuolar-type H+-ATPase subunit F/Vma7
MIYWIKIVYGFGSSDSDCFACNGNENDPEVVGIDGILEVYQKVSETVTPKSLTNFSKVIKSSMKYASDPGNKSYFILLILTDGIINDMKDTINEIVEGSSLPISIVIVGIGNHDFKNMIVLGKIFFIQFRWRQRSTFNKREDCISRYCSICELQQIQER